ncbi:MAG: VanZ family protein [Abditibacteriota bacterium]|nr:VanZ family protein [Abditibacteriota bacterium]
MLKLFRFFSMTMLVIWALVIFNFSAQSATDSGALSHDFTHRLLCAFYRGYADMPAKEQRKIRSKADKYIRKVAHFSVFTVFGFISGVASLSFLRRGRRVPAVAAIVCLLYAFSDELHQVFVPGRACELTDIVIDFAGSLLGIAFAGYIAMLFHAGLRKLPQGG